MTTDHSDAGSDARTAPDRNRTLVADFDERERDQERLRLRIFLQNLLADPWPTPETPRG